MHFNTTHLLHDLEIIKGYAAKQSCSKSCMVGLELLCGAWLLARMLPCWIRCLAAFLPYSSIRISRKILSSQPSRKLHRVIPVAAFAVVTLWQHGSMAPARTLDDSGT